MESEDVGDMSQRFVSESKNGTSSRRHNLSANPKSVVSRSTRQDGLENPPESNGMEIDYYL